MTPAPFAAPAKWVPQEVLPKALTPLVLTTSAANFFIR